MKICQHPCLTRAVHQAQFPHPAVAHARLHCQARTVWTGRSSLWVHTTIYQRQQLIMEALFVYALQQPERRILPRMVPESDTEHQLQQRCRQLHAQVKKH